MNSFPSGPYNSFVYFISPNPWTSINPYYTIPTIHPSSFISPFSSIIGQVMIKENVYIAPTVSIRADEGAPFYIGSHSNIQDGVIFHGLANKVYMVNDQPYSIYLGDHVTVAHGAMVHGPCVIEEHVFVGFNAIVFNAYISKNVYISTNAVVTNGVSIREGKFVPPNATIDSQEKADALNNIPKDKEAFAKEVLRVNSEFPFSYSHLFGKQKCSCGLCCD